MQLASHLSFRKVWLLLGLGCCVCQESFTRRVCCLCLLGRRLLHNNSANTVTTGRYEPVCAIVFLYFLVCPHNARQHHSLGLIAACSSATCVGDGKALCGVATFQCCLNVSTTKRAIQFMAVDYTEMFFCIAVGSRIAYSIGCR